MTVEITPRRGGQIYYTLDGTRPAAEHGIRYEEPVTVGNVSGNPNVYSAVSTVSAYQEYAPADTVDKAVILQAVEVTADGAESGVTCAAYFIAMGSKAMYRDLAVVSIVTEPAGLFDYFDGIYVTGVDYENALASEEVAFNSANYYRGGSVPAHVQYFPPDKSHSEEADVTLTLRKDGNLDYGQKSFLLTEESGETRWQLYGGGTDHAYKIRQILEERLLEGGCLEQEPREGCMVFLDGEFWGLYFLREEKTAGGDAEMVENGYPSFVPAELQELYRLVTESDTASERVYAQICGQMDLDSYLEYYGANLYFGNAQFDSFTTTLWRTEEGKWYWSFGDATETLGRTKVCNYSVNTYLRPAVAQDAFFRALCRNPEFAEALRAKISDLAARMTEERATGYLEELTGTFRVPVTATAERYGVRQTEENYLTDAERIRRFFGERGAYLLRYTGEFLEASETDQE